VGSNLIEGLGLGARRARSLARFAFARARSRPHPVSVTFILTHRCNFACTYCNIPAAAGAEMSTAQICGAIDELADAGLLRVSFSGGEVFVRDDTLEILAHAKSRGLFTSLNSNAWLVEPHLSALATTLDMLVLSLDGPADSHDALRRRPGSYDRVVSVLRRAKAHGLSLATITVLTPSNLHVVDEVLALARELGFWAYFQPAYVDCFAQAGGFAPGLSPPSMHAVAAQLETARRAGSPVGASSGYLRRLESAPTFGDCERCHAGRYFATVMPDGELVPCHLQKADGGPFPNGLASGFARAFADLPRPAPGPGCVISPYQESDLIFSLDPSAIIAAASRAFAPGRRRS